MSQIREYIQEGKLVHSMLTKVLIAIDNGIFWVDAKARQVTIFGSGNQHNAYAALDVVGRTTIRV
jgi:hypothetical protein